VALVPAPFVTTGNLNVVNKVTILFSCVGTVVFPLVSNLVSLLFLSLHWLSETFSAGGGQLEFKCIKKMTGTNANKGNCHVRRAFGMSKRVVCRHSTERERESEQKLGQRSKSDSDGKSVTLQKKRCKVGANLASRRCAVTKAIN
jgi:hypothetical protein